MALVVAAKANRSPSAARDAGLGLGDLRSLGQRHLTGQQRLSGLGAVAETPSAVANAALAYGVGRPRRHGQPARGVRVATGLVGPALRRPGRGQGPQGGASLLGTGQHLHHLGAIDPRQQSRITAVRASPNTSTRGSQLGQHRTHLPQHVTTRGRGGPSARPTKATTDKSIVERMFDCQGNILITLSCCSRSHTGRGRSGPGAGRGGLSRNDRSLDHSRPVLRVSRRLGGGWRRSAGAKPRTAQRWRQCFRRWPEGPAPPRRRMAPLALVIALRTRDVSSMVPGSASWDGMSGQERPFARPARSARIRRARRRSSRAFSSTSEAKPSNISRFGRRDDGHGEGHIALLLLLGDFGRQV